MGSLQLFRCEFDSQAAHGGRRTHRSRVKAEHVKSQQVVQRLQSCGLWAFGRHPEVFGETPFRHDPSCRRMAAVRSEACVSLHSQCDPSTGERSVVVQKFLARLREEKEDDGWGLWSPDEGARPKGSGSRGSGDLVMVGNGYTARELCDGQTLA